MFPIFYEIKQHNSNDVENLLWSFAFAFLTAALNYNALSLEDYI